MKWRRFTRSALAMSILGLAGPAAFGQHEHGHGKRDDAKPGEAAAPPKCPVMGEPVDFSVFTRTADGPVYFCCKSCIKKFEKEPAKYAGQVAEQRKATAALPKVQVTCPVSGKPVDPKVFVEMDGRKTYLCCKGCIEKYHKDPGKYAAALAGSYTYQTKCPVSGDDIDRAASITLTTGQRVYFCCDGCEKKFLKEPGKYAVKLEEQGTHIDVKNVRVADPPQAAGGAAQSGAGATAPSRSRL